MEEIESIPSGEFTKEDWAVYKAAWIADWIRETEESPETASLRWEQMLNQEGMSARDEYIYARRLNSKCQCGEIVTSISGVCDRCIQNHKDGLARQMRTYHRELAEAQNKYPKACLDCLGYGGFDRPHPVYSGAGYSLSSFDPVPCPTCIGKNRCPRCGTSVFGIAAEGCPQPGCGWGEKDYNPVLPSKPHNSAPQ